MTSRYLMLSVLCVLVTLAIGVPVAEASCNAGSDLASICWCRYQICIDDCMWESSGAVQPCFDNCWRFYIGCLNGQTCTWSTNGDVWCLDSQ